MRYRWVGLMLGVLCAATSLTRAAEVEQSHNDHAAAAPVSVDHASMTMEAAAPLPMLAAQPASGKAREAGFDGTELMESTSADASLAVRCAQASRGLIVVERAIWAQCTGTPVKQDAPAAKASQHQGH